MQEQDIYNSVLVQPITQPLHHAARGEHVNVIMLVLANGASPTKTNSCGQIPSELADPETDAREILANAAGISVD